MQPTLKHHSHYRTIEVASLEIIFFFVVPIALLYFGILPISSRIYVLLIFSMLIYGVIRKQKWTDEELGLTFKNIKKGIVPYAIATLAALAIIIVVAKRYFFHPASHWWTQPHFLFLFVVVSFFQEFVNQRHQTFSTTIQGYFACAT